MRALICAFGSHGDVLPLIATGAELKRRGHDVTLASAEPFGGAARRAGLEFEQLASEAEYRAALDQADLWRSIRGVKRLFAYVEQSIRPTFDFVKRAREPRNTMVIANSLAIGARLANDALKVPLITVHLSPLMMQSRHEAPRLPGVTGLNWLSPGLKWQFHLGVDEHFIDPLLTPKLNEFRAELGLPPIKRLRYWWNAPRRVLLMCPDWFVAPQPDWPPQVRQCGFPRADVYGRVGDEVDKRLEDFLADGDAPVAVTFGSAMRKGDALYRSAIEACGRLGRRCLVLSPDPIEPPPSLKASTLVVAYAPFGAVLPRCAAFVHHGGVGTVAQAFAAGVPQLVVPLAFDQFDNAERVRRLGCGLSANRRLFGPRSAARALNALLASTDVAASARRVAALAVADDAVSQACDEIEAQFAAERTLRGRRGKSPAKTRRKRSDPPMGF